ncbi:MAG: hypothetical protein RLZZ23_452 [Verrucomicrobiota bacterium]
MLDPKFLRENIDLVRKGVARKKFQVDLDAVLAADEARRHAVAEFEVARSAQNAANKEMAAMPKGSPEFQAKVAEMKAASAKVKELPYPKVGLRPTTRSSLNGATMHS